MSICCHNKHDRSLVYPYKNALRANLFQVVLHLYLGLPLFLLTSKSLFSSRLKYVETIEFNTKAVDLRSEQPGNLKIMQFDASLEELQEANLCGESKENVESFRDNRTCEELELLSKKSIQFCKTNAVVAASKKGQGSYYYPTKPVWDELEQRWNLGNSQRFYLTGFPIFHSLERARTTIIFNGYPSLCKTCRFYKLPCDREIDEALLAISIVLMIRAGLFLLSSIQDMLNVRFVIHHEQHPRMNPFQIKRKKKLDRLFVVSSVALWLLVIWLSYTVFESQTCADSVPELYYGAMFFLTEMYLVFVFTLYFYAKKALDDDADPRPCTMFCDERFSMTVKFVPCGHIPGYGESPKILSQESNKMCLPCSQSFEECPLCKRVIDKRIKVFRGTLPSVALSAISFLQMVLPAVCANWNFLHSACFKRDVEPKITTTGCTSLLYINAAMILLGVLGIRISEKNGEVGWLLPAYKVATLSCALFCTITGFSYMTGLVRAFITVASEYEVMLARNMGFSDRCITQVMFPHAFKNVIPNTCDYEEKDSAFYEFFSCKPCDKTSPSSCFGTPQYINQQRYTNYAAMGYMLMCIVDVFGYTAVNALESATKRFQREGRMRNKPLIVAATNEFRNMLKEQPGITSKSVLSKAKDTFSEPWFQAIRGDRRYDPVFEEGKFRGTKILTDEMREDVFNDYCESLKNLGEESFAKSDRGFNNEKAPMIQENGKDGPH
eukprot:Stramenopile-MAST_4_protein_3140